jgi:glycine/D-amino acid oxidase-like deaminating enzyme
LGFGIIRPVFTAHPEIILPAWRQHLYENDLLLEETFDTGQLILVADKVEYKNITARKIIFCDGVTGDQLPWFSSLPFAPNKGECLTLNIPGLPNDRLYKKGMMLCPLSEPDQWWIGSSYEWDFKEDLPTDFFHQKTVALLKEWLKLPFEITGHYASLRPATLERRPFAGLHPLYPSIGILNGMGTKGFSLAPYIARQFCAHLLRNEPLQPEADINRFRRILSGKIG